MSGGDPSWRPETRLVRAGRSDTSGRAVNPPVQRGSTVLFDTVAALHAAERTYGLDGFEVHDALRHALADLSGADGVSLTPSGLAACTVAILAATAAGGEILVPDSVYKPTRRFCDTLLARFGVRTRYYDPRIGAGIAALFTDSTQALFLESPGSLTFEVQDVPAMATAARARGVATIIDDTWSAGILFKPFAHGIDLSAQALTKYQGGHADLLLGAVLARDGAWRQRVAAVVKQLGLGAGAPEDAYLTLRGLRTLPLRLERQGANALAIAQWLEGRADVVRVLHPALASHPDHALFRRDFAGAAGCFSFQLRPAPDDAVAAMLDGLRLFGMGYSWGGYESLIVPCTEQRERRVTPWREEGALIRVSIGLEHPDDLVADLEAGLSRFRALATPA